MVKLAALPNILMIIVLFLNAGYLCKDNSTAIISLGITQLIARSMIVHGIEGNRYGKV